MNYLAHLYLADGTPESLLGNFLGDFIKGVPLAGFPEGVQAGIRQHSRVDAFTDAHPVFSRSRARIQPPHRRYAAVLVDLFYDHYLARHWADYSTVPLPQFSREFYGVLTEHRELLPERLARMAPRMVEEDWLTSYRTVEGMEATLQRLSRRFTRPTAFAEAAVELRREYEGLEEDFRAFLPEAVARFRAS